MLIRLIAILALALSLLAVTPSSPAPAARVRSVLFVNLHTGERLRVDPDALPPPNRLNRFLRSHADKRYTLMDPRLVREAARTARRFGKRHVQIISAFRSRHVNTRMYRRGRGVAKRSRHMHGQALDFRVVGLKTKQLCRHLRRRRFGGVGCYHKLRFVHLDVGPVRKWDG
jgi:uncharacterized protein YcbK (DUF882 family)